MAGRLDEVLALDVVAHSYGVAVLWRTPAGALPLLPSGPGEEEATVCHVVLKRNSTIPTTKKTTFACAEGQTAAFVQVFQGERAMTRDNVLIFALAFAVPSGAPGGVELEVDIDANDNAAVVATVLATGEKHKLQHVGEPNRPEEACRRLAALNKAEAVAEATARLRKRISEVEAHPVPFDSATDRAQAWLHESARGATLAEVETRRRALDDDVRALARDLAARLGVAAAVGAGSGGATARGADAAGNAGVAEAAHRLRQRIRQVALLLAPFDAATKRAKAWLDESARGATLVEVEARRRELDDEVRALARELAASL